MNDFDDLRRRPKTGELEVIVAIADAGSLGGAAVTLECTQSRVSHALGEVERVLGARLFDRSRAGSQATDVGEVVVARAREALVLLDSLAAPARGQSLLGYVRIAAYRSVATHLMTPLLHELGKTRPGVRIEIDDSSSERDDVERLLLDGRSDLGIVHAPVGTGFTVTPFAADDYVLVVPATHRPTTRSGLWRALEKLPLCELRCSGARAAVEACRRHGMTNRTASRFSSESTLLAQIAAKRGFAILPRLAVEPLPDGLTTIALPVTAFRSLLLIRRHNRRSAVLRAVTADLLTGLKRAAFPARKWLRVSPPASPFGSTTCS